MEKWNAEKLEINPLKLVCCSGTAHKSKASNNYMKMIVDNAKLSSVVLDVNC
jgi:hypothetical protein